MAQIAKLYDFLLGVAVGAGLAAQAFGKSDLAMVVAVLTVALRFTLGRDLENR
jgi:hypothetical protein